MASAKNKLKSVIHIMCCLVSLLLCSIALHAHHGSIGSYERRPITVRGTATEFRFVNPHVTIAVRVTDEKGNAVIWHVEGPTLFEWTKRGWNRNSLRIGEPVVVTLFPAKTGKPDGVLSKLVLSTGKEWCCETY